MVLKIYFPDREITSYLKSLLIKKVILVPEVYLVHTSSEAGGLWWWSSGLCTWFKFLSYDFAMSSFYAIIATIG